MPQHLVRAETRTRLHELLESALVPTPVYRGWPGEMQIEHVYLGRMRGPVSHDDLAGSTVMREDRAELDITAQTSFAHESAELAELRATDLLDTIDQVLVDNITLDVDGVLDMLVTEVDGPYSFPGPDGGWFGVATVSVEVHSYLSP